MKQIIFIAVVTLMFLACNQQQVDTKSETEKLMQTTREWSKATATKDVEKILSYWTDDAIVFSAGEQPLRGKAAIRGMLEGSFINPGFKISWEPVSAEISNSGDLGYLLEKTKMIMQDSTAKEMTIAFDAVTIWKKQSDGSWKCKVDVLSPVAQAK